MKIIVQDQYTGELIEFIAEEDVTSGFLNFFYHDNEGNFLRSTTRPYKKLPRKSVVPNMTFTLGDRIVVIIKIIE
ncbi:hypothetical protein [Acinetobacter sp. BSP-28]|uniref:hypothetical protein n=1 Tax=Acinetobacter sp. BSP-28 TaxID=3344661 RepID=UPI00376FD0FA